MYTSRLITYLLPCFYGKKLMLAFCSTHVTECPVVCHITGNERNLIYWMFVLYYLKRNIRNDLLGKLESICCLAQLSIKYLGT